MGKNKAFEISDFSIVVVAKQHNPTLLNPDFLKIREIVPPDFEVVDVVLTPPVSFVKYKQGLTITVEMEKLQVLVDVGQNPSLLPFVPDIAAKYIKTLPHVKYTGVGINWSGFIEKKDALNWLRDRFLIKGVWTQDPYNVGEIRLHFSYLLDDAKCNLSFLNSKKTTQKQEPIPGISFSTNYHHDVEGYPSDDRVLEIVARWKSYEEHLKKILVQVLQLED